MKTTLSLLLTIASLSLSAQTFTPGPAMVHPRSFHTATVLQDGRIFLAGGSNSAQCEIYDPSTNTFRATASMAHTRSLHTATLLNDGRVLIAGGHVNKPADLTLGTVIDYTAEVFDPHTETFTAAAHMLHARYSHSAVRLSDGRVLLTGGTEAYDTGFSQSFRAQVHAEVYNPATNAFSAAPDMKTPRWYHTSTLLPDNTVLVVGCDPGGATPCGERYNASATAIQDVAGTSVRSQHTATLLPDGRVLLAGGSAGSSIAELFQPSTSTFQTVPASSNSAGHTATLLADGRVLFTGWSNSGMATTSTAMYTPGSGIGPTTSMTSPRIGQTASILPGGTVLVAGGNGSTSEIFDPNGTRPGRHRAARE